MDERYPDQDELDRLFPPALDDITDEADGGPVTALARWRRTTTSGALLTALGLGLREVFEMPREEKTVIVEEAPGAPLGEQEIELHFDPDHPEKTWAVIRTWAEEPESDED